MQGSVTLRDDCCTACVVPGTALLTLAPGQLGYCVPRVLLVPHKPCVPQAGEIQRGPGTELTESCRCC
jgi:hypothetical protein